MAPNDSPRKQDPRAKERMKRIAKRVLLITALIAVIFAIWGISSRIMARSQLKKRTASDAVPSVVTVKPTLNGTDDELVLPGNALAFIEAPIYARTSGYLKNWYTDIGTHVHKGQLLAEIETPEVDRQLAQARADLETARANATLAKTTNDRWKGHAIRTWAHSSMPANQPMPSCFGWPISIS
jgi:multidrug efflux pump subunit AcrA (membrane-fusion protein)